MYSVCVRVCVCVCINGLSFYMLCSLMLDGRLCEHSFGSLDEEPLFPLFLSSSLLSFAPKQPPLSVYMSACLSKIEVHVHVNNVWVHVHLAMYVCIQTAKG